MSAQLPATACDALSALRGRSLGASELLDATIAGIQSSTLGALELLDERGAREQAQRADRMLARGEGGALAGLPVLIKDVIDVEGLPTRGGTASWRRLPSADAAGVAALRAAGAVVLGKGHTNELAFGIDGRNPHRAPCLNPHDRAALPGGSSSGPAVALAGRLVLGALGTDTSGSIRVPAALCGVAGLRPSYGRISLQGVLPLAPSYDVLGPMARCVADLRVLFAALSEGAGARLPGAAAGSAEIQRVSVIETLLDPEVCEQRVAELVRRAAEALRGLGVEVDSVSIPALEGALQVHRDVQLPEAASSVRALGVPFDRLGEEVRQRVRSAEAIAAARHTRALRARVRIAQALDRAIGAGGALLAPGCAITAPARGTEHAQLAAGPPRSIRDTLLACTVPLTQSFGPVLTLPVGELDGRPVGAQLLARSGSDERLLDLGSRLEQALGSGAGQSPAASGADP